MKRIPVFFLTAVLFVVFSAVLAGCTSPSNTTNTKSPPLYQSGDIISNTSQNNYGLVIRSYDLQSDNYTYSIVYRSNSGNWNYLMVMEVKQDKHNAIETALPYKITHIDDISTLEIKPLTSAMNKPGPIVTSIPTTKPTVTKTQIMMNTTISALTVDFRTGGTDPLTKHFYYESNHVITTWHWTFGDGEASFEKEPVHTYKNSGSYAVTLKIVDFGGDTAEVSKQVTA